MQIWSSALENGKKKGQGSSRSIGRGRSTSGNNSLKMPDLKVKNQKSLLQSRRPTTRNPRPSKKRRLRMIKLEKHQRDLHGSARLAPRKRRTRDNLILLSFCRSKKKIRDNLNKLNSPRQSPKNKHREPEERRASLLTWRNRKNIKFLFKQISTAPSSKSRSQKRSLLLASARPDHLLGRRKAPSPEALPSHQRSLQLHQPKDPPRRLRRRPSNRRPRRPLPRRPPTTRPKLLRPLLQKVQLLRRNLPLARDQPEVERPSDEQ